MASPSERRRNNVKAGIFVLAAVVLTMVTVVLLTDFWESLVRPTHEYSVSFNVSEGVKNLKPGSEVRVGGWLMGRVLKVTPRIEPGAPFQKIDVVFSLDRQVELHWDATVLVTPALIGADAWLEIPSVGGVEPGVPADRLTGYSGPGVLASLLGPANAEKADEIVENARLMVRDARDAVGDVRKVSSQLAERDWPRWSSRIDQVMDWAVGATEKIDGVLVDGRALIGDLRSTVNDNRPGIDSIVSNVQGASVDVQEITRRLRQETVDKVNNLLDTGQKGLDHAVTLLENVEREFDTTWAPELRETLAGARQTAQQLKLASIEVRRSPWKLLYSPKESELEHELLYETTRTFAMAVSDLRAATETAQRLVDNHGQEIAADAELRRRVNDFLVQSLDRYQAAQQKLIEVLLADQNGPK